MNAKVLGITPEGSGATVVHKQLAENLHDYDLKTYKARMEYIYPVLAGYRLGQSKYDVIHCPADYAALLASGRRPLVITFHNYVLDKFMQSFSTPMQWLHYQINLKPLAAMAIKRANAVTAVSDFLALKVRQELDYTGSIHVIPNGIDCSVFTPRGIGQENKEITVLVSGNLTRRKGAHWLAAIADCLGPGIQILCASGLRTGQKTLINHERISIIDECSYTDMPGIYRSCDILLMPSVREGFGLAVAEAMACGLPVVASNVSALPELVHDPDGGFLCEVGDTKGFADRINFLAGSESARVEMGRYNRRLIEQNYNMELMLDHYRSLFRDM